MGYLKEKVESLQAYKYHPNSEVMSEGLVHFTKASWGPKTDAPLPVLRGEVEDGAQMAHPGPISQIATIQ